jgi:hypothetical protein
MPESRRERRFTSALRDRLSGLRIPPLACRSRCHIKRSEARDTDRFAGREGRARRAGKGRDEVADAAIAQYRRLNPYATGDKVQTSQEKCATSLR